MAFTYYRVKDRDAGDASGADREISRQGEASLANARNGAGEVVGTINNGIIAPKVNTQGNKQGGSFFSVHRAFLPYYIPSRFDLAIEDPYSYFTNDSTWTLNVYRALLQTRSAGTTESTSGVVRYYLNKVKLVQADANAPINPPIGTPTFSDFDNIWPSNDSANDPVSYDDYSGYPISATINTLNQIELNATAINHINQLFGSDQGGQFTICMMNYDHDYLNSDPNLIYNVAGQSTKQYIGQARMYSSDVATGVSYEPLLYLYWNKTRGKIVMQQGKTVITQGKVTL